MATFSSKHEKNQSLVDPNMILVSIAIIGILVVFGPLMNNSSHSVLLTRGGAVDNVTIRDSVSFASDLQYWDAKCSHGWTSDSACDALVSKTQSCSVGLVSAYCSEYDTYLQEFRGR